MKKNVGAIDAIIRIDLAFVLAYIYYTTMYPDIWHTIGLLVSAHLLATAVFGTDPLYKLFNLSTNKGKGKCGDCGKNETCAC